MSCPQQTPPTTQWVILCRFTATSYKPHWLSAVTSSTVLTQQTASDTCMYVAASNVSCTQILNSSGPLVLLSPRSLITRLIFLLLPNVPRGWYVIDGLESCRSSALILMQVTCQNLKLLGHSSVIRTQGRRFYKLCITHSLR